MKTAVIRAGIAACAVLFSSFSEAQEEADAPQAAEDPAHEELRDLRPGLLAAVEKQDLDAMLEFLHPDVVVTWLNGEQSRGHQAVRDYYNRMMKGEDRIVDTYRVEAEATELTRLYGEDFGVSYGTATSYFNLTDGREFTVTGPWTATVARQDGRWLVTAFHSSANMFDNPVLDILKNWMVTVGLVAAAGGLLLGIIVTWLLKRRRTI